MSDDRDSTSAAWSELSPERRRALFVTMKAAFVAFERGMAAVADTARLAADAFVRADRREWERPELVLDDDERDAIRARQLGRTLADIDDLPEVEHD